MALKSILDFASDILKPYIDNVKNALSDEVITRSELGAKNLLPNNLVTHIVNGVTYTINEDKTITCSGSATSTSYADIPVPNSLFGKTIIVSGCPSGGDYGKYRINVLADNVELGIDEGNGVVITIPNNATTCIARILVYTGYGSGLTFKPMIRLATDSDTTYQLYAMTNRELTDALSGRYVLDSIEQLTVSYQTNDTFGLQLGRIYTAFTNYLSSLAADDIVFVSGLKVSGYNPLVYQGVTYFAKSSTNIEEMFSSMAWGASNLNLYRACVRASSPYFQEFAINGGTTQNITHTDDTRTSGQGMVLLLHKYKKI